MSQELLVPTQSTPAVRPLRRDALREIAEVTLKKLEEGSYEVDGVSYDLSSNLDSMKENTVFYPPDSDFLSSWSSVRAGFSTPKSPLKVSALELSTLEGARHLSMTLATENHEQSKKIGVLNFASAKHPGGGFLSGAQAQEESLARSSTLYPSLMTPEAQKFYVMHKKNPQNGYYSHAMIYSPRVLLIRDDVGGWREPLEVNIVVSAAVNAGVVRRTLREIGSDDESGIRVAMTERMARVLYLFESEGIRNLVLGSFGTGVFRNNVEMVASIWAELLTAEDARFNHSFDCVIFAVLGSDTFKVFERKFNRSST